MPAVPRRPAVAEDGAILEGLSSNFFGLVGGALHTEEERVLAGLTRSMVLEIAADLLPGARGAAQRAAVRAQEAFITSASRERPAGREGRRRRRSGTGSRDR